MVKLFIMRLFGKIEEQLNFSKNLVQKGFDKKIQKTTGLVVDSYFSASKINWLLKNVKAAKELLKKTGYYLAL